MKTRADYGLDAPEVVRNLALVGVVGLGVYGGIRAAWWRGTLSFGHNTIDFTSMSGCLGTLCAAMALYMVWSSKYGKVREREVLLAKLALKGTERILDVGCGRGLMLIGAAKRLTTGSAVGIDIWQTEDLSGNRREATLENVRLEGVESRVRVETADMRALPFPDASFDVVVSKAAIHNLYAREERAKALAEIVRVMAPGAQVLIDDIRHLREYEAVLRAAKLAAVKRMGNRGLELILAILTWGSLRPGILLGRK